MYCRFPIQYIFFVLIWAIPDVCPPQGLLWVLVILFSCYLPIWPFCYILSVPIFSFKIVLFLLHPIVGSSRAFSTYLSVEFSFLILECPILFVLLDTVSMSFKSFAYIFWFISSSYIDRRISCFWDCGGTRIHPSILLCVFFFLP